MAKIERSKHSYSAYIPDLPGCVAAAETEDEVLELIKEAMELHLESLRNDGEKISEPNSSSKYIEVEQLSKESYD